MLKNRASTQLCRPPRGISRRKSMVNRLPDKTSALAYHALARAQGWPGFPGCHSALFAGAAATTPGTGGERDTTSGASRGPGKRFARSNQSSAVVCTCSGEVFLRPRCRNSAQNLSRIVSVRETPSHLVCLAERGFPDQVTVGANMIELSRRPAGTMRGQKYQPTRSLPVAVPQSSPLRPFVECTRCFSAASLPPACV
jgi:hypothetical protein